MSGTHPIGGSSSNASQNQPANQSAGNVPGAFPGVPLRIPAGAPRPPFNQGIWEEQQDGSLIQITANYKGTSISMLWFSRIMIQGISVHQKALTNPQQASL